MASGVFPPLDTGDGDPGGGLPNKTSGTHAGRSFPEWGDPDGNFGQLTILRLEAEDGQLPKKPFLIRKSVEAHLGTKISDAFPERQGVSYVLRIRNARLVEKLQTMTVLCDGTKVRVIEHPTLNMTRCVISCKETTSYTTEELLQELKDQGVKDVRRITRLVDGTPMPTPTVILSIKGSVAPQSIYIGWIRCRTRPYYPSPMVCCNCYEYGHSRARCPAKEPTCGTCSDNHVTTPDNPCSKQQRCKHCKTNDHATSSRKCPTYLKENDIQRIRVDQGIGYPAARRLYEAQHPTNTLATIVAESNDKRFADMERKINDLTKELGRRGQQVEALMAETRRKDKEIAHKNRQIAHLEAALATANANNQTDPGSKDSLQRRLELTRTHGTIEDLVEENRALKNTLLNVSPPVVATDSRKSKRGKGQLPQEALTTNNTDDETSAAVTRSKSKKVIDEKVTDEREAKRSKGNGNRSIEISDSEDYKMGSTPDQNIAMETSNISADENFWLSSDDSMDESNQPTI